MKLVGDAEKNPVGVLISGRGSNLLSLLNASRLTEFPFKVVCVVSNKEAEGLCYAKEFDVPSFVVNERDFVNKNCFENEITSILKSFGVQMVCLAGYMKILGPSFVETWKNKLINIHPSLLPLFKGLNAQKQALDAGVEFSGCTVHFVDEGVDNGEIILQKKVPVMKGDTVESLSERILKAEHECYPLALKMLFCGA